MTRVLILALLVACGPRSGVTPAAPRLACTDCPGSTVATHAKLAITTSWAGECSESTGGGIFPVTSDSGQHDSHEPCELVAHTPKVACVGGTCTVKQLESTSDNERRFEVEVVSTGIYDVRAELTRTDGRSRTVSRSVRVARPNRVELFCTERGISARLAHEGGIFEKGPSALAMSVAGTACSPYPPDHSNRAQYIFDCPVTTTEPVEITVTGADFAFTQPVTCR